MLPLNYNLIYKYKDSFFGFVNLPYVNLYTLYLPPL